MLRASFARTQPRQALAAATAVTRINALQHHVRHTRTKSTKTLPDTADILVVGARPRGPVPTSPRNCTPTPPPPRSSSSTAPRARRPYPRHLPCTRARSKRLLTSARTVQSRGQWSPPRSTWRCRTRKFIISLIRSSSTAWLCPKRLKVGWMRMGTWLIFCLVSRTTRISAVRIRPRRGSWSCIRTGTWSWLALAWMPTGFANIWVSTQRRKRCVGKR
ncbi:hypothetical protein AMAG_13385 [Allomyces macrogynus ATCC 38327]|uniref:Uncharacterized protein n=1 Tax=Allomyces macrogynus (strain ATCC 38327) TaxID=578462 RepID=A0A0L0T1M5_ALLM3|nr:hypothetical protein AMAG_13385 [Allomyces macrogynus ATCC 38327]|eukprot:KNE68743.1 hypothetical protein AMAG_13385 [Allomyces macrogynus ATCC 38327]